jgi:AcrR family transcriptional regulator
VAKQGDRGLGRGLELLWGHGSAGARGPKPALSLDEIVQAAIGIADRDGLGVLSMRLVAEKLGFTTMSLYRYVPGKDDLLEVMRDVALGQPPAPEADSEWRCELARWARACMAVHHRHPWLLEMEIRRPPFGPNHLRWLDAALRCIAPLEIADERRVSVVLVVDSYVRGAARVQVGMAREERRTRSTTAELDRIYGRILETVVTDERYPMLAKAIAAGTFMPSDPPHDEFEFGLERVLDGIAALAERRRHHRAP